MPRTRVSTTVDADRLDRARALSGLPDSKLLDSAVAALLEQLEAEHELAALERAPYEHDEDVAWDAPPVALPYDGPVPDAVLDLARRRRERR
jgi:hypothetical protein